MEQNLSVPRGTIPVETICQNGKGYLRKYKVNVVRGFAIMQTIIGILTITAGILSAVLSHICRRTFCIIGYGVWCGLLVLTNIILNTISTSISIFPVMFAVNDIKIHNDINQWTWRQEVDNQGNLSYLIVLPSLILVFVVIEIIISIVNASLSCKAACQCCNEVKEVPSYAFFDKDTQKFVIVRGRSGITPSGVEDFGGKENFLESRQTFLSKDQLL